MPERLDLAEGERLLDAAEARWIPHGEAWQEWCWVHGRALLAAAREREELEREADACMLQRDELLERLARIRAAADSDADLAGLPALRDFLFRETRPEVMHIPPGKFETLDQVRAALHQQTSGATGATEEGQ